MKSTDHAANTRAEVPNVPNIPSSDSKTLTQASPAATASFETSNTENAPSSESARTSRLQAAGWLGVERLCHGGMGELYRGYDPNLQKRVVAKFIRSDAISESTLARFRTEAATLARLEHPNVARLFAYVEGEDPYLVIEYVEGGTLSDQIRSGHLSARDAATMLEGVARGVAVVHASLVIHRDLKPSNILVSCAGPNWVVKVTDFGMAKDIDALESMTATNAVLGTPEYMSPEQANPRKDSCDVRSDVWGLAATLYAAVTGHPPFTRNMQHPPVLTDPLVPPQHYVPDLPPDLCAIIVMGLEKHPNDRYQSATEFADDLKRFLDGQPVLARRRAWPIRVWRRVRAIPKPVLTTVAALFVAGVSLGAVLLRDRSVTDGQIRFDTTSEREVTSLMNQLEKGLPTTFLGSKGTPPFRKMVAGLHVAEPREIADGALVVEAANSSYCQLTPNIPIDRYDVRVEVSEVNGLQPGNTPWLGLIVGLTETHPPQGGVVYSGFAVRYYDSNGPQGGPVRPRQARFEHSIHWERPGLIERTGTQFKAASPPFLPSRLGWPLGKWRPLRFSITPERLIAYWIDDEKHEVPFADFTTDQLNAIIRDHGQEFQVQLPPWSPRRPVAIICTRCAIGVRNLTITPQR